MQQVYGYCQTNYNKTAETIYAHKKVQEKGASWNDNVAGLSTQYKLQAPCMRGLNTLILCYVYKILPINTVHTPPKNVFSAKFHFLGNASTLQIHKYFGFRPLIYSRNLLESFPCHLLGEQYVVEGDASDSAILDKELFDEGISMSCKRYPQTPI